MNDVDPQAWLADVLARIASTRSLSSTSFCRGTGRVAREDTSKDGLTIAATCAVVAISYVTKLNGEEEYWLRELSMLA